MEKASQRSTQGVWALAWVKNNVAPHLSLAVIKNKQIDDGFAKVFGLTDAEVAALNLKLGEAAQRLDELSIIEATVKSDDAKGQLTVRVPSLGAEGGEIHDELLQAFATILGADRFQNFISIAGDSWEQSFHSFGLEEITYEVKSVPSEEATGDMSFVVKETSFSPDGGTSVSDESLSSSAVGQKFPVLGHFLPSTTFKP